jgi:hypothetical protein
MVYNIVVFKKILKKGRSMRKKILFLVAVSFFLSLTARSSFAQLVDWERYNKYQKQREAAQDESMQQNRDARMVKPSSQVLPNWKIKDIRVISDEDRRYDVNRDGFLQLAESKVYLKRVVTEVQRKRRVAYRSDLLKEYDTNKDGFISQEEVSKISADLL